MPLGGGLRRGRLVPACPPPPTSHSPAAAQPEPADPAQDVQEDGQASGAGRAGRRVGGGSQQVFAEHPLWAGHC